MSAPGVELFRGLELRTNVGVLYDDADVAQHDGFIAVTNRGNPLHFSGNMLVFPNPPQEGDLGRWLALWNDTFGDRFDHRTFEWDRTDGDEGAAQEFVDVGFELHRTMTLVAAPEDVVLRDHDTSHVEIVEVDLAAQADDVIDLAVAADAEMAAREGVERHREFQRRQVARRERAIAAGNGVSVGARAKDGQLVASLGVLRVNGGLGRYQQVDTHPDWRRQGICSRLLHEAARLARQRLDVGTLVIAADREYHALDLYRKVGFQDRELTTGLMRTPARTDAAAGG
jgi:ribosomal protein S18 acetylase RimI-like enzyme